jgi:hypothetical protein
MLLLLCPAAYFSAFQETSSAIPYEVVTLHYRHINGLLT